MKTEFLDRVYFSSIDPSYEAILAELAGRKCGYEVPCVVFSLDGVAARAMDEDLDRRLTLRPDLVADGLRTEDQATVTAHWKYSRGDALYPRSRIQDGVTACLRDKATGQVVGFCFSHPYGAMAGLWVAEEHRRGGLGSLLVALFIRGCIAASREVWLHTVEENVGGVAFFKALGFKEIGADTWIAWTDMMKLPPVG